MKPNRIMCMIPAGIAAGIFMFSSCHSGYSLASVEGNRIEVTAALDANPDSTAIAILTPYQKTVDSIMSPVIGQSARFMDRFRPESELSNLVADILRCSASAYRPHSRRGGDEYGGTTYGFARGGYNLR